GDGQAEVVFGDETSVTVYRGATGESIYMAPRTSLTGLETPVIADIDNDGHADIVIVYSTGYGTGGGIRAYNNIDNNWVATRPIWNQHGYYVTNVMDDGRIPAVQVPPWRSGNLFRGNAAFCKPQ